MLSLDGIQFYLNSLKKELHLVTNRCYCQASRNRWFSKMEQSPLLNLGLPMMEKRGVAMEHLKWTLYRVCQLQLYRVEVGQDSRPVTQSGLTNRINI